MSDLLSKLEAIHFRFVEVGKMIVDPDIISDMERYVKLNKEYKDLEEIDQVYLDFKNLVGNIQSTKELLETETDAEMREMAKEELLALEERRPLMEEEPAEMKHVSLSKTVSECIQCSSRKWGGSTTYSILLKVR